MPIDIKDVKAGIQAGRLFVMLKDDHIMLGDYQTGEAVQLSDVAVRPFVHARLRETGFDEAWCNWGDCSHCGTSNIFPGSKFCMHCGARLDGDLYDECGQ